MAISKASAAWDGALKGGRGSMKPAHGADIAFSASTRFEGVAGSNPEELIGAALAGCFSMALAAALGRENMTPESIRTEAEVHLEKLEAGFTITKIDLTTTAKVPGVENAKFQSIAEETKKSCPVSRALTGTKINLKASLG